MSPNALLTCLDVSTDDKILVVIEDGLADANFIVTHLIKDVLEKNNKLCLVIVHNTIGHYHNVLKRLGCDLLKKVEQGYVKVVEPLKTLAEDIANGGVIDNNYSEQFVERLFFNINSELEKITEDSENIYLIIDDLSHLYDLTGNLHSVTYFLNRCVNFTNNSRFSVVIGVHVSDNNDSIIRNSLGHVCDLMIEVSGLKTGRTRNVTGVIDIHRMRTGRKDTYHYQATEKEIKPFCPGEAVNYLYW